MPPRLRTFPPFPPSPAPAPQISRLCSPHAPPKAKVPCPLPAALRSPPPQVPRGRMGTEEVGSCTDRLRRSASRSPGTGTPSARPGAGKGAAAAAGQPWRAARGPGAAAAPAALSLPVLCSPRSAGSCAPRRLYIPSAGLRRRPPPAGGARAQGIGLGRRGAVAALGLLRASRRGALRPRRGRSGRQALPGVQRGRAWSCPCLPAPSLRPSECSSHDRQAAAAMTAVGTATSRMPIICWRVFSTWSSGFTILLLSDSFHSREAAGDRFSDVG